MVILNKICKTYQISLICLLALFYSCSDEEISPSPQREFFSTAPTAQSNYTQCASATYIRPKVDFLFIMDNTGSSLFLNNDVKNALNQTVSQISDQFDYRILLAPLVEPNPSSPTLSLISYSPVGLDNYALSILSGSDLAGNFLLSLPVANNGNIERGFHRAYSLINSNQSHGIFRNDSYVFIVMMSTGDDNGYYSSSEISNPAQNYAFHLGNFESLKSQLNSLQFRFISLVPFQNTGICQGFELGDRYTAMSSSLYNNHNPVLLDQTGDTTPDSYNICTGNIPEIFAGANDTINAFTVGHVYNYWPITNDPNFNFDPNSIVAIKNTGQRLLRNDPNGFLYIPSENPYVDQPIRISPSVGEVLPGPWRLIKLLGEGQVQFPECLSVSLSAPNDYFGWVAMQRAPRVETIKLWINGEQISQSASNGWEYVPGFQAQKNIKILGLDQPNQPGLPPIYQSGYFLKLNGSAIYTNGASIEVQYTPSVQ